MNSFSWPMKEYSDIQKNLIIISCFIKRLMKKIMTSLFSECSYRSPAPEVMLTITNHCVWFKHTKLFTWQFSHQTHHFWPSFYMTMVCWLQTFETGLQSGIF